MFKSCLLSISIILLISVFILPANATSTRTAGMGNVLLQNPWMLDDLQPYVYENPAFLGQFKNSIFFEYQGHYDCYYYYQCPPNTEFGGIILNPLSTLNIGVFSGLPVDRYVWNSSGSGSLFHHGDYSAEANYSNYTYSGNYIDLSSYYSYEREMLYDQNAALLFSYDFSNFALGLYMGYAASESGDDYNDDKYTYGPRSDEYSFLNEEYRAGLGSLFKISDGLTIDGNVHLIYYNLKNSYDAEYEYSGNKGIRSVKYESDNAYDINSSLRFNINTNSYNIVHIKTGYNKLDRSTKGSSKYNYMNNISERSDKFKRTGWAADFGISDELRISDSVLTFIGLNCTYEEFKHKYKGSASSECTSCVINDYQLKSKYFSVPVIFGMEAQLYKKLSARFGLSHEAFNYTVPKTKNVGTSNSTGTVTESTSHKETQRRTADSELSIGLTFQVGDFDFDWVVNAEIFREGPYLIS